MERQALKVKFMSGFELSYGGKAIATTKEMSSKARQLLAALLFFNKTGISREKIISNLYQNEDTDAANSFKALTFRLRKKLKASGLPEGEYAVIKNGMYYFGDAVPLETDTDRFYGALRAAKDAADDKEREIWYRKACDVYGGEFLPLSCEQMWVIYANAELVSEYLNAARWLNQYYDARREYEAICSLNKRVSVNFPFDEEWYIARLNALLAMGKYKQGFDEYEKISSMLFDEMGVYPSERLMECARAISDKVIFPLTVGEDVSAMLSEEQSRGAYYCSYPGFADSYHVLKRIMDRDGIASCLLLCTVTDRNNRPLEDKGRVGSAIRELSLALGETLRKSDMYTRYSSAQMLVMLWGTDAENVGLITGRIDGLMADRVSGAKIAYTVLKGKDEANFTLNEPLVGKRRAWHKMERA